MFKKIREKENKTKQNKTKTLVIFDVFILKNTITISFLMCALLRFAFSIVIVCYLQERKAFFTHFFCCSTRPYHHPLFFLLTHGFVFFLVVLLTIAAD